MGYTPCIVRCLHVPPNSLDAKPRTRSPHGASHRDRPDRFDAFVADADEVIVQIHYRVAIPGNQLQLVAHSISRSVVHHDPAVFVYRIAHVPRVGRKALSSHDAPARAAPIANELCANAHGFSLHAGVRCAAEQRSELELLCSYITRLAVANERQLQRNAAVS